MTTTFQRIWHKLSSLARQEIEQIRDYCNELLNDTELRTRNPLSLTTNAAYNLGVVDGRNQQLSIDHDVYGSMMRVTAVMNDILLLSAYAPADDLLHAQLREYSRRTFGKGTLEALQGGLSGLGVEYNQTLKHRLNRPMSAVSPELKTNIEKVLAGLETLHNTGLAGELRDAHIEYPELLKQWQPKSVALLQSQDELDYLAWRLPELREEMESETWLPVAEKLVELIPDDASELHLKARAVLKSELANGTAARYCTRLVSNRNR